jgi:Inner membrane protein YgaP-like, transmembrane domain
VKLFVQFMVSAAGRWTRVIAGAVLIVGGLFVVGGPVGIVVAVVGLVPLLAGAVDVCVFAPIFGYPFSGPKARAAV